MIFSRTLLKAQAMDMLNACVTNNRKVKQKTYKTAFKNNEINQYQFLNSKAKIKSVKA